MMTERRKKKRCPISEKLARELGLVSRDWLVSKRVKVR